MNERAIFGNQRALDDFIFIINLEAAIGLDHQIQKVGQVLGKQRRGIARKLARQVHRADNGNTLVLNNLIGL